MNAYELKQQTRRERFETLAEKAAQSSESAYNAASDATAGIPLGQPILVGHHSEKRQRAAMDRSDRAMRKSCDESKKAKYYASKAASVGRAGVSSDDPDAITKLCTQLDNIEKAQERMKAANKVIRTAKTPEKQIPALVEIGFSEEMAKKIVTPDFAGRTGFASYVLTNNNANGKRIKKRIEELEARSEHETVEIDCDGYSYSEDTEENRVMFMFGGKPGDDVRAILKRYAFKWSPSRGAWVRQLTNAGVYAGKQVRAALLDLDSK